MKTKESLSVGQVARRCGVKVSTLHFYEAKGLIKSSRNAGNQRRYQRETLRRIAVIKAAQKLGVSLAEIKNLLTRLPDERTPTKSDWRELSEAWRESLESRISKLQKLRDSLTDCIGCGCLSLQSCPIYNPEDILANQGDGGVYLDN